MEDGAGAALCEAESTLVPSLTRPHGCPVTVQIHTLVTCVETCHLCLTEHQ